VAVAWVVFLDVVYCFPIVMPVTKTNMNYVSIVVTGLVAFVVALWFTSKKGKFTGPKIDMAQLTERRMAAITAHKVTEGVREDIESLEVDAVVKI